MKVNNALQMYSNFKEIVYLGTENGSKDEIDKKRSEKKIYTEKKLE